MTEINVMHIVGNLDIGGAQEVVRTLTEYLNTADGCHPLVCTFRDGPLRQEIEQRGIRVVVLPQRRHQIVALPLYISEMVRIYRSLAELVKTDNIDIIQTHNLRSLDFVTVPLLHTTDLRVVLWTFHSTGFEVTADLVPKHKWLVPFTRFGHRTLYRLSSRWVSGFVAISAQVRKSMIEVIGNIERKITVICNGVDTRRYGRPVRQSEINGRHLSASDGPDGPGGIRTQIRSQLALGADTRLMAMVGTLKEAKGHRFMIEAMADLVKRYPNLHLLLIGDGRLRSELQAQVAQLGLDNQIHFMGNRQDVPDLLAASDIFVLPSLWEGLSMALLEAMASGLPIVASAVSGTIQVITHDETGLLVPPGDVPKLVETIASILDDPDRAQHLGKAAQEHVVREFSAQKQAQEHLALYRHLLSPSPNLAHSDGAQSGVGQVEG